MCIQFHQYPYMGQGVPRMEQVKFVEDSLQNFEVIWHAKPSFYKAHCHPNTKIKF